MTHRKIAERAAVPLGSTTQYFASLDDLLAEALEHLSASIEKAVGIVVEDLAAAEDRPRELAKMLLEYLSDPAQVRIEYAFYIAHMEHPRLRTLFTRWYDGLLAALLSYTDPRSARAVALYCDGVMLHVMREDTPLEEDEVTEAIRRLMQK